MQPLISVIIPVFNVEHYLKDCLDSVLGQSSSNLEILLIDDGSSDQSGAICDQYAEKDPRITVVHQENRGLSSARNRGISLASGEWISFVDSDDWIEADMLEKMLNTALAHNADICICGFLRESEEKTELKPVANVQRVMDGSEAFSAIINENVYLPYVCNKLYRKAVIDQIPGFPVGRNYEDSVFNSSLLPYCRIIACLPDCLYHYRKRSDSIVNVLSLKNQLDKWISYKEIFETRKDGFPACYKYFLERVIIAHRLAAEAYAIAAPQERKIYSRKIDDVVSFARIHSSEVLFGNYSLKNKVSILLGILPNQAFTGKALLLFKNIREPEASLFRRMFLYD